MPLRVHTARIGYRGDDGLAVTRLIVTDSIGLYFAPSERILRQALAERAAGRMERHWPIYRELYLEEMRASYRLHRLVWDKILDRPSVTLLCFCSDPSRCHRTLLAEIFVKCGAVFEGEVEILPPREPEASRLLPFDS